MYPEVLKNADIILSDNNYWRNYFEELAGTTINYKKLASPVEIGFKTKENVTNNKKILWVSRICNQKLIEVLYDICKSNPDLEFTIYGNLFGEEKASRYFSKILMLKNIVYRGTYNIIDEILINDFDLYNKNPLISLYAVYISNKKERELVDKVLKGKEENYNNYLNFITEIKWGKKILYKEKW